MTPAIKTAFRNEMNPSRDRFHRRILSCSGSITEGLTDAPSEVEVEAELDEQSLAEEDRGRTTKSELKM